jgi:hypothetical protein
MTARSVRQAHPRNETRIPDSRCAHSTGGKFLRVDAGGSAAEHGDRCGNAETRQARSEVDAAAQSARGRGGNSHTRKARSSVFSEIGVANTMHIVVAADGSAGAFFIRATVAAMQVVAGRSPHREAQQDAPPHRTLPQSSGTPCARSFLHSCEP